MAQDLFDDFPKREVEFGSTANWEDLDENPTAEIGFDWEIDFTANGRDRLLTFSLNYEAGQWRIYSAQVSIPDYEELAEYADIRSQSLDEILAALPMQVSAFGHACRKTMEA